MKRAVSATFGILLAGVGGIVVPAVSTAAGHAEGWQRTGASVAKGDISAVAALGERDAWAVGYRLTSDTDLVPIALHWDGTSWTQQSMLPAGSFPQVLTVRAANDMWTAGADTAHWDGTAWTSRGLAADPGGPVLPNGLATTADGQAWVVGQALKSTIKSGVPAVQTWDGTRWNRQVLPDLGNGELSSVVAIAPNDVWAAGLAYATGKNSPETTLLLHWDGTNWVRVDSPNLDANPTWIGALTSSGANDVWAVGGALAGGVDHPFAIHWDGRSWRTTATPNVADGRLHSVVKSGGDELWALGGKGTVSVALRWNSAANQWDRVPDAGITSRGFAAVPNSSTLWTVGIAKQGDLVPVISCYRC